MPRPKIKHRARNTSDALLKRVVLLSRESYMTLLQAYDDAGQPFGPAMYGLVMWMQYGGKARAN